MKINFFLVRNTLKITTSEGFEIEVKNFSEGSVLQQFQQHVENLVSDRKKLGASLKSKYTFETIRDFFNFDKHVIRDEQFRPFVSKRTLQTKRKNNRGFRKSDTKKAEDAGINQAKNRAIGATEATAT